MTSFNTQLSAFLYRRRMISIEVRCCSIFCFYILIMSSDCSVQDEEYYSYQFWLKKKGNLVSRSACIQLLAWRPTGRAVTDCMHACLLCALEIAVITIIYTQSQANGEHGCIRKKITEKVDPNLSRTHEARNVYARMYIGATKEKKKWGKFGCCIFRGFPASTSLVCMHACMHAVRSKEIFSNVFFPEYGKEEEKYLLAVSCLPISLSLSLSGPPNNLQNDEI